MCCVCHFSGSSHLCYAPAQPHRHTRGATNEGCHQYHGQVLPGAGGMVAAREKGELRGKKGSSGWRSSSSTKTVLAGPPLKVWRLPASFFHLRLFFVLTLGEKRCLCVWGGLLFLPHFVATPLWHLVAHGTSGDVRVFARSLYTCTFACVASVTGGSVFMTGKIPNTPSLSPAQWHGMIMALRALKHVSGKGCGVW